MDFFSLEMRSPRRDLITVFKYIKAGYKEDGDRLFFVTARDKHRSNSFKFQ